MMQTESDSAVNTRVIGVGAAGLRVVDKLAVLGFPAAQFLALDTDCQELQRCQLAERLQLGETTRLGWGCSGDAGEGANAVRSSRELIAAHFAETDLAIIVAGLGGGMGGGGAAVVAEIAAECGALVMVVAIEPFVLEHHRNDADLSLQRLSQVADTVVRLSNQAVLEQQRDGCSLPECLEAANNLILESLLGLGRLMRSDGLLNANFAHLQSIVQGQHGESTMATIDVAGDARSRALMDAILAHPFLRAAEYLRQAKGLIISLAGSESLAMAEVEEFMDLLKAAAPKARLVLGVHEDPGLKQYLSAMILLPFPSDPMLSQTLQVEESVPISVAELQPGEADTLPLFDGPTGQQQLPLVAVSKGKFDKGEPTLHAGEDLDVPTFLRRNMILN